MPAEQNARQQQQGSNQPKINTDEIWKIALEQIQLYISPQNFSAWFKNTSLSKIENGIATVTCQSNFAREWLDSNHNRLIKRTLQKINKSELDVVITIRQIDQQDDNSDPKDRYKNMSLTSDDLSPEDAPIFNIEFTHQNLVEDSQSKAKLNNAFIFESFVVGSSNRLAHAAAEAVADKPGKAYNPLFVYGGVGLGKTHLTHAIGNRIINTDPNKKIQYCPSETFLNEMVEAIRNDKNIEFRQRYRELDVLIIDDIQFISGWESAQTELFHTFNTLYNAEKQIILASDRPPKEIENLTDRLRSRFEGGMLADISKPNYELRAAIIKQKALTKEILLPDNVLNFMAKEFADNIRELEGALIKIGTHVKFSGTIPAEDDIAKILGIDSASKRKIVKPSDIIRNVCKEFGVSTRDVRGKRRTADVVVPRQVCMYLLRRDLDIPLQKVARELNRKDHTTVLHAVERVEDRMEQDEIFRERVERCE